MGIQLDYHRLIVGYHGCDRSVGEGALLHGAPLRPSNNAWDWLGEGVYFWEHGPKRAWEFARWKHRRGEIADPFVLGAYIHLGRCFDLTDTFATRQLLGFYEQLAAAFDARGETLPVNRPGRTGDPDFIRRELDCAVLNLGLTALAQASPPVEFDTVRGVFVEGDEAYPGARIHLKTHVQIAVRSPGCVLGYFAPSASVV